jgi:hypothetical protein
MVQVGYASRNGVGFGLGVLGIVLGVAVSGCGGPKWHPVSGRVTLNGEALPDAIVSFTPEGEEGSPGLGRTDQEGKYVLRQTAKVEGLEVGRYRVHITTYQEGEPDADPPVPPVPERVPPKYNAKTELTADVEPGENVCDFRLESQGRR